jgi:hypothetical protein
VAVFLAYNANNGLPLTFPTVAAFALLLEPELAIV